MRSMFLVLMLVLLALGPVACGGGGGDSTPPAPTAPGTTRIVAVEGSTAPDGGGVFLSFPTETSMAIAEGGVSAFVAHTSLLGEVVYVYTPGRSLFRVFAEGDPAPGLITGAISGIERVWINEDGLVVALVGISGNPAGVTGGILTAEVDAAGVVAGSKHDAILEGRDMGDTGVAGTLVDLFPENVHVRASETFFFGGETDAGDSALWQVNADGTGLGRIVGTGDDLPGSASVLSVYGTAVDTTGLGFAFVAALNDVGSPRGIYTGRIGSAGFDEVAIEGDSLIAPDVIQTIPDAQPMVVYVGPSGAAVLYKAISDLNQDYLILGNPDPADDVLIVKEGQADTKITGGIFGAVDWIHNEAGATRPLFQARMSGAQGITFAVYSLEGVNASGVVSLAIATYNGRAAPSGAGQTFSTTFPGLAVAGNLDASTGGSLAFSNILSPSGDVGLYWLVRGQGLFTTALSGRDIPGGGDKFGDDTTWRQTSTGGAILFRAPVETAGSGIFRRGP